MADACAGAPTPWAPPGTGTSASPPSRHWSGGIASLIPRTSSGWLEHKGLPVLVGPRPRRATFIYKGAWGGSHPVFETDDGHWRRCWREGNSWFEGMPIGLAWLHTHGGKEYTCRVDDSCCADDGNGCVVLRHPHLPPLGERVWDAVRPPGELAWGDPKRGVVMRWELHPDFEGRLRPPWTVRGHRDVCCDARRFVETVMLCARRFEISFADGAEEGDGESSGYHDDAGRAQEDVDWGGGASDADGDGDSSGGGLVVATVPPLPTELWLHILNMITETHMSRTL
jgi:hypothetical protein